MDYVTIQNGTAYVSVNGSLYEFDDIVQVIDSNYLISQYIPKVEQQVINYSHDDPQDVMVSGTVLVQMDMKQPVLLLLSWMQTIQVMLQKSMHRS